MKTVTVNTKDEKTLNISNDTYKNINIYAPALKRIFSPSVHIKMFDKGSTRRFPNTVNLMVWATQIEQRGFE